jgi:hypothetical protein
MAISAGFFDQARLADAWFARDCRDPAGPTRSLKCVDQRPPLGFPQPCGAPGATSDEPGPGSFQRLIDLDGRSHRSVLSIIDMTSELNAGGSSGWPAEGDWMLVHDRIQMATGFAGRGTGLPAFRRRRRPSRKMSDAAPTGAGDLFRRHLRRADDRAFAVTRLEFPCRPRRLGN